MQHPHTGQYAERDRLMFELSVYLHTIIRKLSDDETNSDMPGKTLFVIQIQQPVSLKSFCDILGVSAPAGSIMIDKYVKKGLIVREPDPNDRRKVLLSLTPEGTELIDRCKGLLYQNLNASLQTLSEEENEEFYNALATTAKYIHKMYPAMVKRAGTEGTGPKEDPQAG